MASHPQAAAHRGAAVMAIVRSADSPTEPMPRGVSNPIRIRVVRLTRRARRPACARTLDEHGADVMKINGAHLPQSGYQDGTPGPASFPPSSICARRAT